MAQRIGLVPVCAGNDVSACKVTPFSFPFIFLKWLTNINEFVFPNEQIPIPEWSTREHISTSSPSRIL